MFWVKAFGGESDGVFVNLASAVEVSIVQKKDDGGVLWHCPTAFFPFVYNDETLNEPVVSYPSTELGSYRTEDEAIRAIEKMLGAHRVDMPPPLED